jgi:hypothetical protein
VAHVLDIFVAMSPGEYGNIENSNIDVGGPKLLQANSKRSNQFRSPSPAISRKIAGKPHYIHFSKSIAVAQKFDSEWSICAVYVAFFGKFRLFSRNVCIAYRKGFTDRVHLEYSLSWPIVTTCSVFPERIGLRARLKSLHGRVENKKNQEIKKNR